MFVQICIPRYLSYSKTKLADVLKYLDELPCSKVPRMKTGSEILDEEHVVLIEKMTVRAFYYNCVVKDKLNKGWKYLTVTVFRCLCGDGLVE